MYDMNICLIFVRRHLYLSRDRTVRERSLRNNVRFEEQIIISRNKHLCILLKLNEGYRVKYPSSIFTYQQERFFKYCLSVSNISHCFDHDSRHAPSTCTLFALKRDCIIRDQTKHMFWPQQCERSIHQIVLFAREVYPWSVT